MRNRQGIPLDIRGGRTLHYIK